MKFERFDKTRHDQATVKGLLAMAMGSPTPERLRELIGEFSESATHVLLVAVEGNEIDGVISVDCQNLPHGFVTRLAVAPDNRDRGIGRDLLGYAGEALGLKSIELETDQDAVGFYRSCGFTVREINSSYPGIRRFSCSRNVIE